MNSYVQYGFLHLILTRHKFTVHVWEPYSIKTFMLEIHLEFFIADFSDILSRSVFN
jgi:hypothetical protein